jgi:hypothetical protein
MIEQFRRFLCNVPWIPLIVGATLGVVGALAYKQWFGGGPPQPGGTLEVAIALLLGGIIGWVIPEFVNALRLSWQTARPLRTLLNPFHKDSNAVSIFLAALYPTNTSVFEKSVPLEINKTDKVVPHHGVPWVLVESDAQALGYVMALLSQAGRTANISIVRDDIGINIAETNIICVGSPKSNYKSRQINSAFKRLPVRFGFENDRQVIVDENGKPRWRANDTFDYGMLAKLPNEHDPDKAVIILAGISYVGTAGVGYYLWKRWREIEALTQGKYFTMILKIRRDNYQYIERDWEYVFPGGHR